jgi:nucleotide-binding universal stress UspA family protein
VDDATERQDVTGADERRIVVGVDGSPATHVAVRWAAEHARQLGRDLVLLHGVEEGRPAPFPAMPRPPQVADRSIYPYLEALGDTSSTEVERRIVDGPPSKALIAAGAEAIMIVLGRPAGFMASLPKTTSLTRRVLAHAPCPVVVVPERLGAEA